MAQSGFERHGGFAVLSKVVMALYDKILDSDVAGPFFDGVDVRRVIDHQTKFISSLLGGPASYSDDQIRKMHSHLSIGPEEFEALLEILVDLGEERQLARLLPKFLSLPCDSGELVLANGTLQLLFPSVEAFPLLRSHGFARNPHSIVKRSGQFGL